MTLEDDLRSITTAISQKQSQKTRAEIELENATNARTKAQQLLKEEFGIETNEDAKDTLIELEAALEAEIATVQSALASA